MRYRMLIGLLLGVCGHASLGFGQGVGAMPGMPILPNDVVSPRLPSGFPSNLADASTPIVRLHIRTLAAVAPGQPLVYKILVNNPTSATAYRVSVRHPAPPGVLGEPKMEPEPNASPNPATLAGQAREYVWTFSELKPGATKEISVTYQNVDPNTASVKAKAFVSFEHGQAVLTEIEKPKLTVRKAAPESVLAGEPVTVRVEVLNHGAVTVSQVKLTENFDGEVDYVADGDSEPGTTPNSRIWNLGNLAPGQAKRIEYRIKSRGVVGTLTTTSNATGKDVVGTPASAVIKLLTAKTELSVAGPEVVEVDGTATYTARVTNTGTMPLSRLRIIAFLPNGTRVVGFTEGGQRNRERIVWEFQANREEGPLKTGQSYQVNFKLKAAKAGEMKVTIDSDGGPGLEESRSVTTTFRGAVSLSHVTTLEPGLPVVGQTGQARLSIANRGNQVAKNILVTIRHEPGIEVKPSTAYRVEQGRILFNRVDLPASSDTEFIVTYTARTPGRVLFDFEIQSDQPGEPLRSTKSITIQPAN